eukprot:2281719-Prymnesium_polylepis.3
MDGLDEAVTPIPKGPATSLAGALWSVPGSSGHATSPHRARSARFPEGMSVRTAGLSGTADLERTILTVR